MTYGRRDCKPNINDKYFFNFPPTFQMFQFAPLRLRTEVHIDMTDISLIGLALHAAIAASPGSFTSPLSFDSPSYVLQSQFSLIFLSLSFPFNSKISCCRFSVARWNQSM
jgi:hypothetical protein